MIFTYLVIGGLAFTGPPATEGAIRADLSFEPFSSAPQIYNLFGGQMGRGMPDRSTRYAKEYQVPKTALKPVFYKISIGTRDYVAVRGKSKAGLKAADLMWVDWNGDKSFSDNELAKPLPNGPNAARYDSELAVFMPTSFEGGIPKAAFACFGDYSLNVIPAGCMVGKLPIGNGLKVGLTDSNGNGSYGDVQDTSEAENYDAGDVLYVDWNGNGKFDEPRYSRQIRLRDIESLPFAKVLQLDGKAYYRLEVDPDGAWLEAKPYDGEWASVTIKGAKAEGLYLTGPDGIMILDSLSGTAKVPAVNVSLSGLSYAVADPKGKVWHATVTFYDGDARKPVKLSAGKDTVLKCGAPFKASLSVMPTNNAVQGAAAIQNFSIEILDAGGNNLTSFSDDKDQRPKPPTIDIKDAKGKVVKSLKLSYG